MKSCTIAIGGFLVGALVSAAAVTGAAQAGSAAKRVEPFTPPAGMRLKPLDPSSPRWTDAHRQLLERKNVNQKSAAICAYNLDLCQKWWDFTTQLSLHRTHPERDREVLVLRTAYLSRGEVEWGNHARIGKNAGITDEEITKITQGPDAPGLKPFDRTLLRAVDELHTSRFITDPTWKALDERYDEGQLIEVLFVVGNYTLISMFYNTVGL